MAEKFEKTYITIHEFIESWEKEIYELNQLDYFIFILINKLGYQIEHNFFSQFNKNPYLQIDTDEIGTLSFNLGDSLESFLENNCLQNCDLSCPIRIDKSLTPEEKDFVEKNLRIVQLITEDDLDRKQFLITDILNYVVLDTLFDFYNYDIGVDIEETDLGLLKFADFITDIIERFFRSYGHKYLDKPEDSAAHLFNKIVSETESSWNEIDNHNMDEDLEDSELWKSTTNKISLLTSEFLSYNNNLNLSQEHAQKVLEYLSNFMVKYSGIQTLDDFELSDIEEFVSFWLIRELTLDSFIDFNKALNLYKRFFSWLELSKEIYLSQQFNQYVRSNHEKLEQALDSARTYLKNNSIINGMLEVNSSDTNLLDGYFEIVAFTNNGFLRLKDIHMKKIYYNVRLNKNFRELFQEGNIIEATIKPTPYGWRLLNLEYIFPQIASPYLH